MARLRHLVLLASVAVLLPVSAAASGVDQGTSRPPARLTEHHKAIWMSEWVACWRPQTMRQLANELNMKNIKIFNPQQGAEALSKRAMKWLYEDPAEARTALDGCRNGILWRFYHD
jgi:hypothetical protein